MEALIHTFYQIIEVMQLNMPFVLTVLAVFWAIHFINLLLSYRLNVLGLYPRTWHGLIGIACAPFLHANTTHLFFNSLPLFLLTNLMLLQGVASYYVVSLVIIGLGGALVWLFARPGFHIGASGLIMGYLGYILMHAYLDQSLVAVIIGILGLYYCGSLLLHLLPVEVKASWEGHVFGFIAGVAAVWII